MVVRFISEWNIEQWLIRQEFLQNGEELARVTSHTQLYL